VCFYSHFFTIKVFPFTIASVIFLQAELAILLKVGAETHIFNQPSFMLIHSKLISFIASNSSQNISIVLLSSAFQLGAKHLQLGSKHTDLSFFGLDI
jgi:hypothetical protein